MENYPTEVILLLVDSEDTAVNLTDEPDSPFAWQHLQSRDGFERPVNTKNYQALLMATCMETWIATDSKALTKHYEKNFQESALPTLPTIETQHRHDIQKKLAHATRNTTKPYQKGTRSFAVLASLDPDVLATHLTQFRRFLSTLKTLLK